jgi:ATP-dependent protease HslVU (ClpYQ) ATPase subunit
MEKKIKKLKRLRIAHKLSLVYDSVPDELIDNEEGIKEFIMDYDLPGEPTIEEINDICKNYSGYSDRDLIEEILPLIDEL